jgi:penicillin-binding protein 1A
VFPAPPTFTIPGGNANGQPWVVTNYEHESVRPQMSLIDATALSVNTVYAQVVARIGADKLDSMAKALGIDPAELPRAYPSQVLGTADVSPLEMTAAYATLADGGVYHAPILVTKVTRADGTPLPLPVSPRSRRVLSPDQAALETYVLQQVVQRGTGVAAGGIGTPVAGKTGTTEHSIDAWFIGYTPKMTTSVWMGYADRARSMDGFRGLSSVTGGTIPAQLWHDYMAAAVSSFPQLGGSFPLVTSFGGKILTPTNTLSTTTTFSSPSTSTSSSTSTTTVGSPTTASVPVTTVPAVAPPTTAAKKSQSPPTTSPSPTTTSTTVPPPSTTGAAGGG